MVGHTLSSIRYHHGDYEWMNEDDEYAGLDLSQHSENAYVFATGGYGASAGEPFGARPLHEHGTRPARAME